MPESVAAWWVRHLSRPPQRLQDLALRLEVLANAG